jgi:hypothetical protein
MIWNLDINFGQIEDISSSASEYASSMKELKSALNKFLAEVKTNEGQAVQALQEKPQELTEALDKNAEGLELISTYTFCSCNNLEEVTIPSTVKAIWGAAFDECDALETIHFGGSRPQWEAITGNGKKALIEIAACGL